MKKTRRIIVSLFVIGFSLTSLSACSGKIIAESETIALTTTALTSSEKLIESTEKSNESSTVTETSQSSVSQKEDEIPELYSKGIEFLISGKYAEAQNSFEQCGSYKNSTELVTVCKAEQAFLNGNFNSAMALYSTVPNNLEVAGFGVQTRKRNISSRIALAQLTGTYNAIKNDTTVRKYSSKKKWKGWNLRGIGDGQFVSLTCTANSDGTYNVTGTVTFWKYIKYSNSSSVMHNSGHQYVRLPIKLDHITKFPSKITLDKGCTLTYKKGEFVLNYQRTVKSGKKKKTVYKSIVTYK